MTDKQQLAAAHHEEIVGVGETQEAQRQQREYGTREPVVPAENLERIDTH